MFCVVNAFAYNKKYTDSLPAVALPNHLWYAFRGEVYYLLKLNSNPVSTKIAYWQNSSFKNAKNSHERLKIPVLPENNSFTQYEMLWQEGYYGFNILSWAVNSWNQHFIIFDCIKLFRIFFLPIVLSLSATMPPALTATLDVHWVLIICVNLLFKYGYNKTCYPWAT